MRLTDGAIHPHLYGYYWNPKKPVVLGPMLDVMMDIIPKLLGHYWQLTTLIDNCTYAGILVGMVMHRGR